VTSQRTGTRIIEASRRLLELSADTPVADLAAAAGVSRSTFYRHFADRASLLAAIRE
jgi:AcrR family transcriptional regulator